LNEALVLYSYARPVIELPFGLTAMGSATTAVRLVARLARDTSDSHPLHTSVYPRGKGRVALANVVNTGQCGVDLCVAHPDLPPARTRNRCIAHALDIQCVPSQLRDAQPALFAPRLTQARRIITIMKGDANN